MTRLLLTGLIAVTTVAALGTGHAAAQAPVGPGQVQPIRPPISPYLNLLRRGGGPALNYYNLVRPQQQLYAGINNLQQQATANRALATAALATAADPTLPATGKATMFLNTGGYFMNMTPAGGTGTNIGVGVGAPAGAVRPGPQPLPGRLPASPRAAPRR